MNFNTSVQVLLCFEHTEIYSLSSYLKEHDITFTMVPGLEIKRSLGIKRGKDDKIDAKAISFYAWLRTEHLKAYELPCKGLLALKSLLSQRACYKASLKEIKHIFSYQDYPLCFEAQQQMIQELSRQIIALEKQMKKLIKQNKELNRLFGLVTSVKGVGLIVGVSFLVYTNGFTMFTNWRRFAAYSGTAPFPNRSGSRIRGRTKVSHLANKKMKTLLFNAACTAIEHSAELKHYYKQRIAQGKSEMATQNIIRNKSIARVFAVVKRGTPYVEIKKYAA